MDSESGMLMSLASLCVSSLLGSFQYAAEYPVRRLYVVMAEEEKWDMEEGVWEYLAGI